VMDLISQCSISLLSTAVAVAVMSFGCNLDSDNLDFFCADTIICLLHGRAVDSVPLLKV